MIDKVAVLQTVTTDAQGMEPPHTTVIGVYSSETLAMERADYMVFGADGVESMGWRLAWQGDQEYISETETTDTWESCRIQAPYDDDAFDSDRSYVFSITMVEVDRM